MNRIEILSLVVTIICLISFCLVFTFLFRHYYLNNIKEIKDGREDFDLIEYYKEEKNKEDEKKEKTKKIVSKVVNYSFLGLLIVVFGFSVYSRFFNNNLIFGDSGFIVISSGSMSEKNSANTYLESNNLNNQFDTYDIIGINKYQSIEDISLYDVVAFYGDDGTIYVHRIIEINDDNTFVTRGDSNATSDTNRLYDGYLEAENIIGYYNNNRVPLLGIFIIFLQSNSGIITILSIVYCLLMFDYYRNKYDESIIERIDYLKSIINFDLYDENKLKEELKVIYEEHIYFDNKDYLFNNSQYVSFKELTNDIKINVNEETFINEEKDKKDIFFGKIKKLFKKERKD